jgi:iron complex transport system substrate-binding protein
MAGRQVEIPDTISRIVALDSRTTILLFPCTEGLLIAKGMLPGKKQYTLISAEYKKLPDVDISNLENVLTFSPDIIIASSYIPEKSYSRYDKIQSRLNIPVVVIDLSINKLNKTYDYINQLLNSKNDSEKYSNYLSDFYKLVDSLKLAKQLSGFTAYYTLGAKGLMTDPSGSMHTEVFDMLNIPNTAKIEIPSSGHTVVSMEQVLTWAPDYIFSASFKGESNAYNTILTSSLWKQIPAVKNGRVFKVPGEPFGWFDHPPSINRIPGILWLCEIFYDLSPARAQTEIIQFYKLFYKYDLSVEEYNNLVNR